MTLLNPQNPFDPINMPANIRVCRCGKQFERVSIDHNLCPVCHSKSRTFAKKKQIDRIRRRAHGKLVIKNRNQGNTFFEELGDE